MCPPPCGPRRGCHFSRFVVKTERIAKRDVDAIIGSEDFVCTFKPAGAVIEQAFDATKEELHRILRDPKTTVMVVGTRYSEYRGGKKTIVMAAPCVPGRVILRLSR